MGISGDNEIGLSRDLPCAERLKLLEHVIECISHALVITDAQNIITYVNPAYERLTGYRAEEVVGKTPRINQSGRHDQDFYQQFWDALSHEQHWEGEIWDRRADGSAFLKYMIVERLTDEQGEASHHIALFHDISDRKQAEEELDRLLHYDPLTMLPNRLLFRNRLQHEFNVAARHRSCTGVIVLNLDRFKQLNDTFGFTAGDQLIKEVADRLDCCIRNTDLIARQQDRVERDPDLVSRMGGDDFAFILSEMRRPEDAGVVAERILASLREPFQVGDEEVFVSASMGIAIYPQNADDSDGLMQCAESALKQVKAEGRGGYRFFSPEINISSASRVRMEAQLRRAIEQQELTLHYQPKFSLASGEISGMEALLRWPQRDGGMISPVEFIPMAEDTGLIIPLGEWILQQAFADTLALERRTGHALQVAVNLSARQFQHHALEATIRDAMEQSGIPAHQVELELTESMLMHNVEDANRMMQRLRGLGVSLAIDDFGTGYSSLAYLRQFPVNTLKIDRSFVNDLSCANSSACIITAIIGLGEGLGLTVVAEGIETAQQHEHLKQAGCALAQGYYLARPTTLEQLCAELGQ